MGQAIVGRLLVAEIIGDDAAPAAHHAAMREDVAHHAARQVDRDGKADALNAGGVHVLGDHRGVDADQFARGIDQGAAGIAFVDGRVGLDEILEGGHAQLLAIDGTDDAVGDRLLQAERVADGQHLIADLQPVRAPQAHDREPRQPDRQQRQVGVRITAHHLGHRAAAVGQLHLDAGGIGDHVVVGDDVAALVHDHARAQRALHALLKARPVLAKQPLERVGLHLFGDQARGVDVDHGRRRTVHGAASEGSSSWHMPVSARCAF